jgi:hypothetical protein
MEMRHTGWVLFMDKTEQLRKWVLRKASERPGEKIHIRTFQLAYQFKLPQPHVEDEIVHLVVEGLIEASAFDGRKQRDIPIQQWGSVNAFFQSSDDAGYIRIRSRSRGRELVEDLLPSMAALIS